MLKGYLNGIGDGETKFRVDGVIWHRTGDSGYFDDRGRLWLLGRTSAVIKDHHGELYPFAVECAVRQLPGVLRAALIGRESKRILYVQAAKGADLDLDAVRAALGWADLDQVRLLAQIPLDRRHNARWIMDGWRRSPDGRKSFDRKGVTHEKAWK
ncbi:AMP-binding protein [Geotalea toluenoxydans]|uniref:AMP-binding protein n=1 Tax=Geotalea toluenoxydans TaxID=421624 RepID=UPI0006D08B8A|nr:AMP-binding protein [Geotalea toluenoxydans]